MKKVAAKRIRLQVFSHVVCEIPEFEDWLDTMADDIRKLEINTSVYLSDYLADTPSSEILKIVCDKCSKNLIEFRINIAETNLMDELNLSFPNLEKLTVDHIVTAGSRVLPSINFPKHKQLEMETYDIQTDENHLESDWVKNLHLGISIDNLTVLKLQYFDDVIANLFMTLSDKICEQLTKFTVYTADSFTFHQNRLVPVVRHFRNLVHLNILFPIIEFTNFVHLFERCIKLVKLSLNARGDDNGMRRLLMNCKKHCNALKVIHLVTYFVAQSLDEKICQFIVDEFPNVQLYKVVVSEADKKQKYKIAILNKPSVLVDCEVPY